MSTHELKVWPEFYEAIRTGRKLFEVRRDDRGFDEGDELVLREWDTATSDYTGRYLTAWVAFILRGPGFGVEVGYVVMSLDMVSMEREQ